MRQYRPLTITLILTGLLALLWAVLPVYAQDADCDPERPEAFAYYLERGGFYRGRGEGQRALIAYLCAAEIQPDSPVARRVVGNGYAAVGDYESALQAYDRVVALTPDDPTAYLNRGWALTFLERYDEAVESLTQALEMQPDYALAYLNRGNAYYLAEELDKAVEDYLQVVEMDYQPIYQVYQNLGRLYVDEENWKEALHWYEKALAAAREVPENYRLVAEVQYELGDLDAALENYQFYVTQMTRSAEPHVLERVRELESRTALFRFLPLLMIGVIVLYAVAVNIWDWWQRRKQGENTVRHDTGLQPAAPESLSHPPLQSDTPMPVQRRRTNPLLLIIPLAAASLAAVGHFLTRDRGNSS